MIAPSDLAACRARLRDGSRSFALAARLLPGPVADAATGLYAFCRVADDVIDEAGSPGVRRAALTDLERRLDAACAGRPADAPEDRALAAVLHAYGIPRALPAALLEGFAWDAAGRRYDGLDALEGYAVRVAGTVGMMMCLVMGERRPAQLARACDLGVAMQLTNVARDVGEDAAHGRLYLPVSWLRVQGVDVETWLARPAHDRRSAALVARLLDRAAVLYRRADVGIERLPRRCRFGIRAARRIYADIGAALAARDFDAVTGRAVVGPARKLRLVAGALRPGGPQADVRGAPHADALALIAAVAATPAPMPDTGRSPWIAVADLFQRLDRRTRLETGAGR